MIRLPEGRLARALLLGGALALPVAASILAVSLVSPMAMAPPQPPLPSPLNSSDADARAEAERSVARTEREARARTLARLREKSAAEITKNSQYEDRGRSPALAHEAALKDALARLRDAEKRLALVDTPTVDEALGRLKTGTVAFDVPARGRATKPFLFEAKLSATSLADDPERTVREVGRTETSTLKISKRMTATLVGGAFDIAPSGPQEQWISDREPTSWTWAVTPKAAGRKQVLVLGFDAIIAIDGKDEHRTVNTFKREIDVDVAWPETVPEWLELIKKTAENASWIWASLLIPIGGVAWGWATGKKSEKEKLETKPSEKPSDKAGDSAPARAAKTSPVADPEHVDPSGSA